MTGSSIDVPTDDASLLASSQTGDVAAFGALIERYHNLVCAIAYSRTGDRIASEDIAQETFLAAWHGLAGLRDASKLRPWLCGISRNLAGKTLRGRRREANEDIDDLEGQLAGDPGPLAALLTKETETTVWAALERLPATYREPLVLFYREQQSIKEVALGLGLTEETAKQRLSRGRLSLRDNIGDLVEQTLQAGRPRKTAAAAVLAAITAAQGTSKAVAATHASRTAASTKAFLGLGAVSFATAAVAIYGYASLPARQARSATGDGANANIAELRRAHAAWKASTTGTQTCALRGTVTRADRSPIAGALVALIEHSSQGTALDPIIVETDGRGAWQAPPIAAGSYTVSVSAPGARASTRIVTCATSGSNDHAFALQATGATLRGSISDVGGGPIAGATVWVLDAQRLMPFLTRTNADGAYEIVVPPGSYMALLTHPDYTLDVRPVTLRDADVREDLTLVPGASIEGAVVDATGTPVPGAKVTTLAPSPQNPLPRWQMASVFGAMLPVVTDANGRFRMRGLPPGTVRLTARLAAFATTNPPAVDLALAEQETGTTIVVTAARTISGFVVARGAETRGMQSVQVIAVREDAPLPLPVTATTDGAGYFALAGLTPGQYRVAALAPGYSPYAAESQITIAERDVSDSVVVLDRGVTLSGRLEPAGPASITLTPAPAAMSTIAYMKAAMTRAEVDEAGNFTFAGVAPGDYVIAATTFDRHREQPIHVANSDQLALHMALEPRPAIVGTVVDDTGAKLADVLVEATSSSVTDPVAAWFTTVRTNVHGAFTIVGVSAGSYSVRVFDAKGQRAWAGKPKRPFRARDVEVPATGAVTEELVVASGGGRITGVVVGADGRSVADTAIEVRGRDAGQRPSLFPSPPVLTDATGRFSIDGLFDRDFVVAASSSDGKQRATAITAVGTDVKLELRPMATLIGKVTRDGKPVPALDVRIRHTVTDESRRERGTAGAFSLTVIAGEHELIVTSDLGYVRQSITIGSEPTTTIELALVPWGSVRGRVVGFDGSPWSRANVSVSESLDLAPLRTDNQGGFNVDRVMAGRNDLRVWHETDRDRVVTFELELEPGQLLDLGVITAREDRPTTGDPLRDLQASISRRRQTTASWSADLGIQLFVSVEPPTTAMLAAVKTDPLIASREGKEPNAVLWIAAVDPQGHAARAGLRSGDRIVGVGMAKVDGGQSAVDMLTSLSQPWRSKGRPVPWDVVRGGRELKIHVLVPN